MKQLIRSLFLLYFMILCLGINGQSLFSPSVQITKPEVINPTKAIIFDIDNDQLNDILVVGSYPDNIVWFRNLGDYKFSEKIPIYSNENPGAQTGGILSDDVNGDEFIDFIAYEYEQTPPNPWGGSSFIYRKCYWRENLQGNGFGEMIEINVDTTKLVSELFDVADIDGDGLNDLVYGLVPTWTKKVSNTEWGESFNIEVESGYFLSSSLGDINNDGLIDFALTTFGDVDTSYVLIYQNMGDGQFDLHSTHLFNQTIYQSIISDYDTDGTADLIAATYDKVYFVKQNISGTFDPPLLLHNTTSGILNIYPVLVADIDGNGIKDVITQDKVLLNNERFLIQMGEGSAGLNPIVTGYLGSDQANGEDYIQLFYIYGEPFSIIQISQFKENVGSFLIHPIAGQSNSNLDNTVVVDFDNDGDEDVISGNCYYECISINPLEFRDCSSFFHKTLDNEQITSGNFLGVFDINNDEFPEIVVGSKNLVGIKKVKFYSNEMNDTSTVFTLEFPLDSLNYYKFLSTYSKDFDSDGLEDFIILTYSLIGLPDKVFIYLNDPQLGLTLNQEIMLPIRCGKIDFCDLDGDGIAEMLAFSKTFPLVIYYSKLLTNGLFQPFESYVEFEDNLDYNNVHYTIGKINDDEILDIYYSYRNNMNEGFLLLGQLPLGTFTTGPNIPGQMRPHLLDDFDEDGFTDLFYSEVLDTSNTNAAYDGYNIFLLENISSIQFQLIDSLNFFSYQNIFPNNGAVAVDFDNDLDKDIIYTSGITQISILENNHSIITNNYQLSFPKGDVVAFPNPTNGIVSLQFKGQNEGGKIEIFDIYGKCLNEIFLSNKNEQIDVSNLQPGVYIFKIMPLNSLVKVIKF